jgi:hypothetical protein
VRSDPTYVGTVQDVQGATLRVRLDSTTVSGLSFIAGQAYRIGQVGSFVRIPLGSLDLFGVVSQVGASAVPSNLGLELPHGDRWMSVQLVGEGEGRRFRRGVSRYPTINDNVHLVTEEDLARIYGQPQSPEYVRIGHLASATSIPALVDVNRLVTRHCAVLGTTGAGKSTTVAGLLYRLSDPSRYPSARILVVDIHGEYARALRDRAHVFRVNANTHAGERELYVPYWALTFDEMLPLTFGQVPDQKGLGWILERITELKRASLAATPRTGITLDDLTVDSPVPFSIQRAWYTLHGDTYSTHFKQGGAPLSEENWALAMDGVTNQPSKGDPLRGIPPTFRHVKNEKDDAEKIVWNTNNLNIGGSVNKLGARLRDPRFDFLFRPGPWEPNLDGLPAQDLDTLLQGWVGGDTSITILDLSGIPPSILVDLIGALLRIVYDALFWARNLPEGGRERPLLVVLEEAHTYLSGGDDNPAARAVRRIAKEGRKYGIGAMLVSQRPSEIDTTVLAQCGTLFAMRLGNPADRGHVTGAAADHLEGLFSMLPILRTGEAIVVGESVSLPIRALIEPPPPDRRPDSGDPKVVSAQYSDGTFEGVGGWNQQRDPEDYAEVVAQWRQQTPRSSRLTD